MATSIIDYICRELAVTYLGRNDLSHVDDDEINNPSVMRSSVAEPEFVSEEVISERTIHLDKSNFMKQSSNGGNGNGSSVRSKVIKMTKQIQEARTLGYTGDICPECQSLTMVRNGTCLKCETCGATTGCS